jgi:hypothetical protein
VRKREARSGMHSYALVPVPGWPAPMPVGATMHDSMSENDATMGTGTWATPPARTDNMAESLGYHAAIQPSASEASVCRAGWLRGSSFQQHRLQQRCCGYRFGLLA